VDIATVSENFRTEAGCGLRFVLVEPVHQLGAGFHGKLVENVRQMVLDRVLAQTVKAGDLAIGFA